MIRNMHFELPNMDILYIKWPPNGPGKTWKTVMRIIECRKMSYPCNQRTLKDYLSFQVCIFDALQLIAININYPKWLPYKENGHQRAKMILVYQKMMIKMVIKIYKIILFPWRFLNSNFTLPYLCMLLFEPSGVYVK